MPSMSLPFSAEGGGGGGEGGGGDSHIKMAGMLVGNFSKHPKR